ncbi:inositol monophosphatase family protein [Bombilactobacillus thymidiniphilus]|uniref:Inositol monophosphatase family protein n=1 Tax=Bombilactobacillus thymidiniphilus TaxID=2923363 RepID=A0ABY4PDA5_9LACO|nr:inositol monophosphatase family protein [Bombilactobacillus thymidiniphilus]UQS83763.1 inositol monophosphatase family protein [Bombilactobacillus thymidiniphilus]
MTDIEQIQQAVLQIMVIVKDQLRTNLNFNHVEKKSSRTDLVTERDKQIEKQIIAFLSDRFPKAYFVSEEGYGDCLTDLSGLVFFVDPIDGTLNFVKSHDQFASMIGVYHDGQPIFGAIADIMQDQIFYGGPELGAYVNQQPLAPLINQELSAGLITVSSRLLMEQLNNYRSIINHSSGLRIFGSAGIIFTRLFQNKEVVYISNLKPWDLAAGLAIGKAMGLQAINIDGAPINMLKSQTVIIGTKCATIETKDLLS